ncbi:MAG: type II toxin-antitoxin system VapC family toxin [Bacillota bacterium]
MITALDASAAIKLALGQKEQETIAAVLKESDWVIVPSIYLYEVSNTLWKYYKGGYLEPDNLKEVTLNCIRLTDEIVAANEIYAGVFNLACKMNSSACDMAYLAVCQRKKAGLLTFDKRLKDRAKDLEIECR